MSAETQASCPGLEPGPRNATCDAGARTLCDFSDNVGASGSRLFGRDTEAARAERPLFPPPAGATALYVGKVMHARLKPKTHRFVYRVFSLLIDLDRLAEAGRASKLFSVGRFNLVAFHERDHGVGSGPLAGQARETLKRAGVDLAGGRILLLCYPRILGYAFNPIATYWCYDAGGALKAVIYEVTNTFHERHAYVAPVADGELGPAGLRQSRDKLMYVSPFLDMGMAYAFRLRPPGENVRLRILESDAEGPILSATFAGEREPLTSATLLKLCLKLPLMTVKVMGAIHWEALRLWLKGIALAEHPPAPSTRTSFDAAGAIRHGRPRAGRTAPAEKPKTLVAR